MYQVTSHLSGVIIWFKNRSKRAHFIKKRSCSTFLEIYDKWKPTRCCVSKCRPRERKRGHKSSFLKKMTALLHYNFLFMCGKGHKYIDLRSVLAILVLVPHSNILQVPNLCFYRDENMSPVHPQGGRRPDFGQSVPCPTPAELIVIVQYLGTWDGWGVTYCRGKVIYTVEI